MRATWQKGICLLLLLASCSTGSGPDDDIEGRYQLKTVNGQQLPQETSALTPFMASLRSGVIVLKAGVWNASYVLQHDQAGEFTMIFAGGPYHMNGNVLALSQDGTPPWTQSFTWNALISGRRLTVNHLGGAYVYER